MNKKIMPILLALVVTVAVVAFAALAGTAKAQIAIAIELKDSHGNNIVNSTVPINTVAYVYGYYEDKSGSVAATGVMDVYYDAGSGVLVHKQTLYNGPVNDGETIMRTYKMTEPGSYEFKWVCTKLATSGISVQCVSERALIKAHVTLIVPEPGTITGLIMALSAFGLLAIRRTKK
jgi:hypothetical protein